MITTDRTTSLETLDNETDSTEVQIITAHRTPTRTPASLLKRAIAAVALMLSLVGVLTVAPTTEASAAGTNAFATVCFTQQGGGAFTGQVTSQVWTAQGWSNVSSFILPTGGCENLWVTPGYYWRFAVTQRSFYGATGYAYMTYGSNVRFTGVATRW